jgi:RNA polymerase sigma-70 factor (ECF subfamily)
LLFRIVEDRELVERAKQGDVESFNVLVSRWEKKLYNYLLRLTSNRDDALDLSQEAFFKAFQNLKSLEEADKFAGWLYRIAHNLAYSKFRGDQRRGAGQTDPWPENPEGEPAGLSRSADRRLHPLELEIMVERAMEKLPDDQREAIFLKVHHGFKFTEIAEILSCPVSTVKSRIYAGLESLRNGDLGLQVSEKAKIHELRRNKTSSL